MPSYTSYAEIVVHAQSTDIPAYSSCAHRGVGSIAVLLGSNTPKDSFIVVYRLPYTILLKICVCMSYDVAELQYTIDI